MRSRLLVALLAAAPVALLAFSTGPPVRRTGAAADGGTDCSVCHRTFAPANSDPRGNVSIAAVNYSPGVKQTVKVTVNHPEALRWGFQLTARPVSDPTKQAGNFEANNVVRVRCDSGSDAPCPGVLQFAEHSDAPFTSAGAGFTFEVAWTPPATDVGDIVFYAAANAANGDRALTGDHIYTTKRTIASVAGCNLAAPLALTGVANAASFTPSISPGAMISLFGSGFQPAGQRRAVGAADFNNNAFPKQFACLAVEVDGKRVPISYAQSDQINVQAATDIATGPVTVRVLLNPDGPNQVASALQTQSQQFSPSLFTFNGQSVAAQFSGTANAVADPAVVPLGKPAKPGDLITLYGTGFGATDPIWQAGDLPTAAAKIAAPFTITIGGTTLAPGDVLYGGASPGSISGLYQFNVRLPVTAPEGNVPVSIQIGGVFTQSGLTIPVAAQSVSGK